MDLSRFKQMDVNMLYSILNMKLRNDYSDLDDLCSSHGIVRRDLKQHMATAGFAYAEELGQFRR
jgi:hypothetical protein